jgi:hypothetical protein
VIVEDGDHSVVLAASRVAWEAGVADPNVGAAFVEISRDH